MNTRPSLSMHRGRRLALPLLVLLSGCAASTSTRETPPAQGSTTAAPVFACTRDAECVVKNVGNCCGYFPACKHVDQPVDPEAVQRECREKGLSSICGFPEITACTCVEGACRAAESLH